MFSYSMQVDAEGESRVEGGTWGSKAGELGSRVRITTLSFAQSPGLLGAAHLAIDIVAGRDEAHVGECLREAKSQRPSPAGRP